MFACAISSPVCVALRHSCSQIRGAAVLLNFHNIHIRTLKNVCAMRAGSTCQPQARQIQATLLKIARVFCLTAGEACQLLRHWAGSRPGKWPESLESHLRRMVLLRTGRWPWPWGSIGQSENSSRRTFWAVAQKPVPKWNPGKCPPA